MSSKFRTVSGAALMLVLIPIFAGLLACMPVPIGDPERSKIDPDITGVWAVTAEVDDEDHDPAFYLFEPYDKRTWLITGVPVLEGDLVDLSKYDFSSYESYRAMIRDYGVRSDQLYTDEVVLYKAWITKLGGIRFLTWESKGALNDGTFETEYWLVHRIEKRSKDILELIMVNGEADAFDGLDKTRKAYERALRKNAKNPDIYGEDGQEYVVRLERVQADELTFVENLASYVISD